MTTANASIADAGTGRTATAARAAIACALASALAPGAAAAPALAATAGRPGAPLTEHAAARPVGAMSEGEAVLIARTHLGIAPEDVFDIDCDLVTHRGGLCWEVEIEALGSLVEHHVLLDARDGTVVAAWDD